MEATTEAARRGAHPLVVVLGTLAAVALISFAVYAAGDYREEAGGFGSNLAGASAASACGEPAPASSNYAVDFTSNPDPPRPEGATIFLTVRRDGRPVTGAKVCTASDMPDMQHPGVTKVATEISGGRYEARLQFGMGGSWRMAVTVAEPGQPVVSLPVNIEVAGIG